MAILYGQSTLNGQSTLKGATHIAYTSDKGV